MSAVILCLFIFGDQDAFCQCDADLWIQFLNFLIFLLFIHTNMGMSAIASWLNQHGYKKRQNNTLDAFATSFIKEGLEFWMYGKKKRKIYLINLNYDVYYKKTKLKRNRTCVMFISIG